MSYSYLCQVEGIKVPFFRLFECHHLYVEGVGRIIFSFYRFIKITEGIVWILSSETSGVFNRKVADTLICLKWVK